MDGDRAPVLDGVARRYLAYRDSTPVPPAEDGIVRAMPVVLRIERDPLPGRTPLLAAAATAAVALCVDRRSQPGGEWHDAVSGWVDRRIRKIARRARGAHWRAVQELPGVTVEIDGAEARALLPGPVDGVAREVSRLQIGGTELEPDDPGDPPAGAPLVLLNPHVTMTVGKAAAQVGHATMLLGATHGWPVAEPADVPRCAVRTPDAGTWARLCDALGGPDPVAVRDAGFTEVDPGTVTCLATADAGRW
ncbi:peptidyl-tRNA hydrolase [Pseudonocardia sp. HH130630-07]|uniref:peptidyl-tRNA hydrolase n=1 Tax=Pseudonocardia sp. HH130630-07 TaxID=1690815 RepID=UPI000814C921|nr:peptidyl-tRNA hydrolase [Pseudonocardia sp. HH130630-07]ANY10156.1 peptidyl-tRNA hydrolase [Pseudonocardia sp. HH130630-07]